MSTYFRAVAVDYDGTLTEQDVPGQPVLEAIARTRESGRRVVLVTGRLLEVLDRIFPAARQSFDAIVAENGAVVWNPALGLRVVAQPVPAELDPALALEGVPFQRGRVLLATDAVYDQVVLQEIARLGLEVQLVRNRGALMLLPPGVSKGTGLLEALGELGISAHSTLAVGDAENDHSLLESCELGVAVANAVPALQAHADVVLGGRAGAGVTALLDGPLPRGEIRVQPKRWQARLGTYRGGSPAGVPGSQINLLIAGGTQTGKSCLAGLLAERLLAMGYVVAVVDPEGDHLGLEAFRGVNVTQATDTLPDREILSRLFRAGSVVLDLSLRPEWERGGLVRCALETLVQTRRESGLPHWIVVDEAQLSPEIPGLGQSRPGEPPAAGYCLVTYQPDRLSAETLAALDLAVLLPGEPLAAVEHCLVGAGFQAGGVTEMAGGGPPLTGDAFLVDRERMRRFQVDRRASAHVRHWHKYLESRLPVHRRFFFRRGDQLSGATAASLVEFHHEIARAEPAVLRHHAAHHDFSRWIEGVIRDRELAHDIRQAELILRAGGDGVEEGRRRLLHAVESRYAAT